MATSIHIPKPLLDAVDHKARSLQVSRNRLIITALEREIERASDWPIGILDSLTPLDVKTAQLLDASLDIARTKRRSQKAPPF